MISVRTRRRIRDGWKRVKKVFRFLFIAYIWANLLVLILLLFAAGSIYRELFAAPTLKEERVLVMNLDGMIFDGPSQKPIIQRFLGEDIQTQQGVIRTLRKAAHDPRIPAILLKFGNSYMSKATTLEIRDELLAFKAAGKKIFAYADYVWRQSYLLAATADTMYLAPPGDVLFGGWRYEIPFYKEMFEKIGITPDFIHIGNYKTAPQVFTMKGLSDEYREVLNVLLDAVSEEYITQIAEARQMAPERVQGWIDAGIYTAEEALEQGIVDELIFEDELDTRIMQALGLRDGDAEPDAAEADSEDDGSGAESEENEDDDEELPTISLARYARVKADAPNLHDSGEKIAVLYAQGSIVSGEAPSSAYSGVIASESMSRTLRQLAEDESIQGIIFRINSGGGGARASAIIQHAVEEAAQKKPIVVSMVGAAASGGYMISAPAVSIVAYPTTLTGSIGIFGGKFSLGGLYDLIGLNIEILQRGQNAAIFTDSRAWNESERATYRRVIQDGYDDFVRIVAAGRGMTYDEVDAIARGRVWTGEQALEIGLVDALGGMETAIAVMKQQLEIPADDDVRLVEFPKPANPVRQIVQRLRNTAITARAPQLPKEIQRLHQQLTVLQRLEDERVFAWFPVPTLVQE